MNQKSSTQNVKDLQEISSLIDQARKEKSRTPFYEKVNKSDIFEKAKEQLQETEAMSSIGSINNVTIGVQ